MYKSFYIFLFIIAFCCEVKAQTNLVPNGSFEDIILCPNAAGQLSYAQHWYKPTSGSSDYFNSCDVTGNFSTPINQFGYQIPFQGNAYVGFSPYTKNTNYSEYIATQLISPLIMDRSYTVSFHLSLSEPSKYSINNIGVYFDKNAVFSTNDFALNSYTPQVTNNFFINNKQTWTKVSSTFKAYGGEEFLIIGNFNLFSNTDTLSNDSLGEYSYYYIDSVGIYENMTPTIIPNIFTPNNDGSNDTWEFNLNEGSICIIYNRWGNKIFETNKNIIKWDGRTTSGEPCTDGIYFYTIQTATENYKGFIQLIR